MNSRSFNESLLRRNALACEQAKYRHCTCQCGGKLHGKAHSEEWIQETADQTFERQFKYLVPEDAERLRRELDE